MGDVPGIEIEYDDSYNPLVYSPNASYGITFYQTKETVMDIEVYKDFLDNAISQFRHSAFYKKYKSYLMSLGLDSCQVMSNINESNIGANAIQMNHNFLTIFDIALMISEHILNTVGYISTFDLIYLLRVEHTNNRVPIVMLNETVHQMHHYRPDLILPAQMCFGYWVELIQRYSRGITPKIAKKIINYIDISLNYSETTANTMNDLLKLKESVEGWSRYNEYGNNRRVGIISYNNDPYNGMAYLQDNREYQ